MAPRLVDIAVASVVAGTVETPAGVVRVAVGAGPGGEAVTDAAIGATVEDFAARLSLRHGAAAGRPGPGGLLREVLAMLDGYFRGEPVPFDVPVDPGGTPFRRRVWSVLVSIPRGEVRTYAEVARMAGSPGGFRAVGGACGANPVPVIIPCHRVVASAGPGGYSGGLGVKRTLLAIEGVEI